MLVIVYINGREPLVAFGPFASEQEADAAFEGIREAVDLDPSLAYTIRLDALPPGVELD
jgi:hypothetical protein